MMRSIRLVSALMLISVMLFLAGLHVYWALGGKWGTFAAVPTIEGRRTINPTPLATSVVAFLLVVGAVAICARVGMFATGAWSAWFGFASWCLCGVFLLRAIGNRQTFGLFKAVHGTPFSHWDTLLYSPLSLVLGVLAAIGASGRD